MPKIKNRKVTANQREVYDVFKTVTIPLSDQALVPLAQHMLKTNQSSSGIRSRRAELVDKGLLKQVDTTTTRSGRKAGVYGVV
jgi:hypothetical protein